MDKTLPSIVFAFVAIVSGLLAVFLPETLGRPLPQSVADGERFGEDDKFSFATCCKDKRSRQPEQPPARMIRVPTVTINDEQQALNEGENGLVNQSST